MIVKKKDGTYNHYGLEVSFGELTAILTALEAAPPDPVADEMAASISYYLDHVPGPGEDKDDFKAKKEAEKEAAKAAQAGEPQTNPASLDLDTELPAPPAD